MASGVIVESPKRTLDKQLISNLLCFEEGSVLATMGEVGMVIRSINLNQKFDSVLHVELNTVWEQALMGVYFLANISPYGC